MIADISEWTLAARPPDILNTLSSLSTDEVITPLKIVQPILDTLAEAWASDHDGASIWADESVTFLDPATKSGVFLREIAARMIAAHEPFVDAAARQSRVDHVLRKQVFGIAITQLTALVARRSVYCSKDATGPFSVVSAFDSHSGNIWFERTEHTWTAGTPERLVHPTDGTPILEYPSCRFCPANRSTYARGDALETHAYAFTHNENNDPSELIRRLFGEAMHFDVIIGNPPYQLGSSGGESVGSFAMPVYQKFIQAAKALEPRYLTMITPSRWFAGGRNLDEFRAEMLSDHRIRSLVDYADSRDVFPSTADIAGGVSYFLWDAAYDGPCEVTNATASGRSEPVMRYLDEYDVMIRNNRAVSIAHKVEQRAKDANLSRTVSPAQPFGLRTDYRGRSSSSGMTFPVALYQRGGQSFIERRDVPRNHAWIAKWKVLLSAAASEHGGQADKNGQKKVFSKIIVAGPGTACTETYLVAHVFDTEAEALHFADYLRTRFVRFLVSLRTNTQHLYSGRFSFVPDLPMDRAWSDEELYADYGLTEEEIGVIESTIKPIATSSTEEDDDEAEV